MRFRRCFAALAAGLIALLPAVGANPAAGDPLEDKKAEAARVATKLEELRHRVEVLAESHNDAVLELQRLQGELAASQGEVAATEAEALARRQELQAFAVSAYVDGGTTSPLQQFLQSSSALDASRRRSYITAAAGDRQEVLDRLAAAREDLDARMAELRAAQDAAASVEADLNAKRQAADATVAEQNQLLGQVQGEVAELVRQEEARRAEEAAKAAQARAVAAAPTRPPANGGGGGGGGTSPGPAPAPDPIPDPGGGAAAAVAEAKAQLGVPYQWAGGSPSTGFDCSGLTSWAWKAGGVTLPHSSKSQWAVTTHIPISALAPGDLVFYGSPISHVGIYVGGGQMIHAPHTGSVVKYDSIYYWDALVGAGRVNG